MRSRIVGLGILAALFLIMARYFSTLVSAQTPPPSPSASRPADSLATSRDSAMNAVLASIAGRENAPAESVFKEIHVLGKFPAGRLVRIMNLGFSQSLGVGCDHCHVAGKWAAEDKPNKQVAREMWKMTQAINTEFLAKIPNLEDDNRAINCTTCHRGEVTPALTLPSH